jgi:hypothetical protein
MFNLDQAIAKWRQRMSVAGIKSPDVLDELESHLREEIQGRLRAGATVEQAFAGAAERLGAAARLKQEFEKIAEERKRAWWRASSIVGGTLFAYSAVFATWILARRTGRLEITGTELVLISGSMFATMFFGFIGRYFAKFLPVIANEKLQAGFLVAGVLLGAELFRLLWNHLSLESLVQTQIVLLWTMSPLLGLGHCFSAWCKRCDVARAKVKSVNA